MKRTLITALLLSLLFWGAFATGTALAQENTADDAPAPALYMPSNVQGAFDSGARSPDGNPGAKYWQNRSQHSMTIDIMPPSRTISATEVITYYNNSPNDLPLLAMQLYLNVHQPQAQRAKAVMPEFLTDGIIVDEFRVNGEVTDWPGQRAPGSTVAVVPLSEPLQPNEAIELAVSWHFDLADAATLAGGSAWKEGAIDDTTYFLSYFYPRVSVYDDIDGWDATEFNLAGEWYGDFVDYTFAVNAPRNFVVWATGDLLNPDEALQPEYAERLAATMTSDDVTQIATPDEIQEGLVTAQDDIVTWQWQADNVRDIAIALSDHFYWDGGSVVVDPETGRRASVQAAYDEEATDFQQMVEFGKSALVFGSTEWPSVPYPYSKTTIIRGGADEEYPMMVNDSSDPEDPAFSRFVAAHEILHSWFPFYMGVDERRYPLLDEGWVTAFEYLINVRDMGATRADEIFNAFRVAGPGNGFISPSSARDIPIITPLDAMQGGTPSFVTNPYGKSARAYLALKELMGDEALKAALHEFMDRWHGKHPLPWDLFNTFNDVSDQDLTWFFNTWFFEPNYPDLALAGVEQTDGGYGVQIQNVGGWAIPFDVNVSYADGSRESFHQNPALWEETPDTVTIYLVSEADPVSVTLDSGIFGDVAPGDNAWQAEETAAEGAATDERVTLAIELTTNPWLWTSFTDPVQQFDVETPENYTITFNTDGTVNVKADCNSVLGTYTADDNGSLSINLGPMTLALCPPDSRGDEFVQKLGAVANFFFENGFLYLDTMADGGTFQLAAASEHMPAADAAAANTEAGGASVLDTLLQQYSEHFNPISQSCPQRTFPIPDPEQSAKRPLDFSPFAEAMAAFSADQAAAVDAAIEGKTVLEIQGLLDSGELTSEQLVLYYLDRIQRYDENLLNSIIELNPDALTTAQEMDAARADTEHGPLYGIPVTLKDNIATVGPMHTTAGAYALKDWQASRDSFLVTQLRDAGAIILGKNNLSEWANYTDPCMPSGFSALGGQTRNPNGPYDTLGSSSGSAVSVAAELTTVSVGSETAGSLVQPARANGAVGMRPSKGLVSGDYVIPLEPTLDTAGPMGRSVTDVAVLLTTLAATDPNEPPGEDAAALADVDFTDYLSLAEAQKLRVGVVRFDAFGADLPGFADLSVEEQQQLIDALVTPSLNGASMAVVEALESQGIEVVLIDYSEFPSDVFDAHTAFINYGFREGIASMFGAMDPPAPITSLADAVAIVNEDPAARAPYKERYVEAAVATEMTAEEYAAAVAEAQQRAEAWLAAVYEQYDIDVLMPGVFYTTGGSAGVPAINIPVGFKIDPETGEQTREPAGVTITGPYLSDAQLIAVGYALEQALGGQMSPDLDTTIAEIEEVTGQ